MQSLSSFAQDANRLQTAVEPRNPAKPKEIARLKSEEIMGQLFVDSENAKGFFSFEVVAHHHQECRGGCCVPLDLEILPRELDQGIQARVQGAANVNPLFPFVGDGANQPEELLAMGHLHLKQSGLMVEIHPGCKSGFVR